MRHKKIIIFPLIFIIIFLKSSGVSSNEKTVDFSKMSLTDSKGKSISFSHLQNKPVLFIFVDESKLSIEKLPQISKLYDHYSESELKIITILPEKSQKEALEYILKHQASFDLFIDQENKYSENFNLKKKTGVVILDNNHVVRYSGGYKSNRDLHQLLFKWMNEKVFILTARQFEYNPNIIEVSRGDRVLIKMTSLDSSHGLFVDGYELYVRQYRNRHGDIVKPEKARNYLMPKEMGILKFKADTSGRFIMRCSVSCGSLHPYMIGYLVVNPNNLFNISILLSVVLSVLFLLFFLMERSRKKVLGIIPVNWRFNIARFRIVKAVLKSRWFPFLFIVINLFVFTIIMISSGTGGDTAGSRNFGVVTVWIVWWVLLMLIMVPFMSRMWCGICPLPVFGDWIQRFKVLGVSNKVFGLNKKWPDKLSNMWIINILFFIITLTSPFITTRPRATFILLGVFIILTDIIISFIYKKRTFCLYICPAGGFQGLYSNFSTLEIRPIDKNICKKHNPKECYRGSEKGYGCPWLLLPFRLEKNTYCGFCFECFKTCSKDNMALNIRPPGVDLLVEKNRGLDEAWKSFIMIASAVVFFLIMQSPWGFFRNWANAKTVPGYLLFIITFIFYNFPSAGFVWLICFYFPENKQSKWNWF